MYTLSAKLEFKEGEKERGGRERESEGREGERGREKVRLRRGREGERGRERD